ncbi:MAG: cyclase family protein [Dehalococcoidia bacterium]|nr:cyclase family protein [Dehalococcoidia bacterium]
MGVNIDYQNHEETARSMSPSFGLDVNDIPEGKFAALETCTLTTHIGTHLDAPWHYGPTSGGKSAKTIDQIPLEWCYSNGVVLDFTHKKAGEEITIADFQQALKKINYQLKPLDIVLVMTGVSNRYFGTPEYDKMNPGVGREPTLWLIDHGVKVTGIDAWGWDRPFNVMVAEVKSGIKDKLWAGHYAGKEKEYCHLENLINLDKIPKPYGFKVAVFPVKVAKGSAGWVRAVAIV